MTGSGSAGLRQLASTVVTRYAGSNADAAAIAGAVHRAYEDLARVSMPLIGALGVDALTSRAIHLARKEYPWVADTQSLHAEGAFGAVVRSVEKRDPASALDGAVEVLALLGTLLASLIGEGLTARLLRQAWPAGYLDVGEREAET